MKKIFILLLLLISSPLMAINTYYLLLLDQLTPAQLSSMKSRIDIDTKNIFSNLKCYSYNNPDPSKATRMIIECDSIIEGKAEVSIFMGFYVKKLFTSESVIENGKIIIKEKEYTHYPTDSSNTDWWNSSLDIKDVTGEVIK